MWRLLSPASSARNSRHDSGRKVLTKLTGETLFHPRFIHAISVTLFTFAEIFTKSLQLQHFRKLDTNQPAVRGQSSGCGWRVKASASRLGRVGGRARPGRRRRTRCCISPREQSRSVSPPCCIFCVSCMTLIRVRSVKYPPSPPQRLHWS